MEYPTKVQPPPTANSGVFRHSDFFRDPTQGKLSIYGGSSSRSPNLLFPLSRPPLRKVLTPLAMHQTCSHIFGTRPQHIARHWQSYIPRSINTKGLLILARASLGPENISRRLSSPHGRTHPRRHPFSNNLGAWKQRLTFISASPTSYPTNGSGRCFLARGHNTTARTTPYPADPGQHSAMRRIPPTPSIRRPPSVITTNSRGLSARTLPGADTPYAPPLPGPPTRLHNFSTPHIGRSIRGLPPEASHSHRHPGSQSQAPPPATPPHP